ncbi:MAG: phosphatidate cytidylyltransferase [Pseudobdellovibrionaceae bacterium]
MRTLAVRAVSAVIAICLLIATYIFYKEMGLVGACFFAVVISTGEILKILFHDENSRLAKVIFYICALTVFGISVFAPEYSSVGFAFLCLFFCSVSIFIRGKFSDLADLVLYQAKGVLGFFYVGLLPALACRILYLPNGIVWFCAMLGIVFAGDTFAYLTGMMFGKNKLMPTISPKKTIEGSLGGLVGSMIAGLCASFYLPHVNVIGLLGLAIVVGAFAQIGDLFESLLKRVANKKDSGSLMPGHGGILDRIDGVLFATPIMLAGAIFLEKLF